MLKTADNKKKDVTCTTELTPKFTCFDYWMPLLGNQKGYYIKFYICLYREKQTTQRTFSIRNPYSSIISIITVENKFLLEEKHRISYPVASDIDLKRFWRWKKFKTYNSSSEKCQISANESSSYFQVSTFLSYLCIYSIFNWKISDIFSSKMRALDT